MCCGSRQINWEQEVAELEESVQMMRENYALVSTAFADPQYRYCLQRQWR